MPIEEGRNRAYRLMRLLQWSDSALPIGTFACSSGLESAIEVGRVGDAAALEDFVRLALRQGALSDGLMALWAHRAALKGDDEALIEHDRYLFASKLHAEQRRAAQRIGRRWVQLAQHIAPHPLMQRWEEAVTAGESPGCPAVAQAITFAVTGLDERTLFCALRYGQIAMLLGAALRLMRLSHYETQSLMVRLAAEAERTYREISVLGVEDLHGFAPEMDLWASLHEQGRGRLFMS